MEFSNSFSVSIPNRLVFLEGPKPAAEAGDKPTKANKSGKEKPGYVPLKDRKDLKTTKTQEEEAKKDDKEFCDSVEREGLRADAMKAYKKNLDGIIKNLSAKIPGFNAERMKVIGGHIELTISKKVDAIDPCDTKCDVPGLFDDIAKYMQFLSNYLMNAESTLSNRAKNETALDRAGSKGVQDALFVLMENYVKNGSLDEVKLDVNACNNPVAYAAIVTAKSYDSIDEAMAKNHTEYPLREYVKNSPDLVESAVASATEAYRYKFDSSFGENQVDVYLNFVQKVSALVDTNKIKAGEFSNFLTDLRSTMVLYGYEGQDITQENADKILRIMARRFKDGDYL